MTGINLNTARSYLFAPADRPERFEKALKSGADVVVIDLEDAVTPENKKTGRDCLSDWQQTAAASSVCLRINDVGHPDVEHDLRLATHPTIAGVMLPKVDGASCCKIIAKVTQKPILALIETARGLKALHEIAEAGVHNLVLGAIDLALDLNIDPLSQEGRFVLDQARTSLRAASSAAGLNDPVDGVHTNLDDQQGLIAATKHAKAFGFGGMLAIHPKQITAINITMAPTADEVDWATRVIGAASLPDQHGAFLLDGRMIDTPIIEKAKRILHSSRGSEAC
jgi:(S)-citramalyl-CoA lyase